MGNYQELSVFLAQNDLQEKAVREKFSDLIRRIGKKDLIDTDEFYRLLSKRIKPAKRPRKKIWELSNAGLLQFHFEKAQKRLAKVREEIKRTPAEEHNKLLKLRGLENELDYTTDRMNARLEEIRHQNIEKLREFGITGAKKPNP